MICWYLFSACADDLQAKASTTTATAASFWYADREAAAREIVNIIYYGIGKQSMADLINQHRSRFSWNLDIILGRFGTPPENFLKTIATACANLYARPSSTSAAQFIKLRLCPIGEKNCHGLGSS